MSKRRPTHDPDDDPDDLDDEADDDPNDAVRRELDRMLNKTAAGRTFNAAANIVGLTLSLLWHAIIFSPFLFFLYLVFFRFSR